MGLDPWRPRGILAHAREQRQAEGVRKGREIARIQTTLQVPLGFPSVSIRKCREGDRNVGVAQIQARGLHGVEQIRLRPLSSRVFECPPERLLPNGWEAVWTGEKLAANLNRLLLSSEEAQDQLAVEQVPFSQISCRDLVE